MSKRVNVGPAILRLLKKRRKQGSTEKLKDELVEMAKGCGIEGNSEAEVIKGLASQAALGLTDSLSQLGLAESSTPIIEHIIQTMADSDSVEFGEALDAALDVAPIDVTVRSQLQNVAALLL